jgi:N-acetylmuramoyl-L-alanine amidase
VLIPSLLLALQVAADPVPTVTIRSGQRAIPIPVITEEKGPMVRVDMLAQPLGGIFRTSGDGRYTLEVHGRVLELTAGTPFVRAGGEVVPLPYEPVLRRGSLLAPYALVADILPRLSSGLRFDSTRAELVVGAAPAARADAGGARRSSDPRPHLVIVDAGHGGPDRGMNGPIGAADRIYEKDITLQVARALRAELRERGVQVVMTRDADTLIALSDRGRIANERRGDLFISIHVNAANPRWRDPAGARGFETYFLSEAKTEDERRVEQMENEVVKFDAEDARGKDDPLSFILHDMEQNQHLRESSTLAATIQRYLARTHPGPNRGVKQAGFRVLVTALMPAVLVEVGFGTNRAEAAYLARPERQRQIASEIADATLEYLSQYDRRSNAGAGAAAR